MEKIIQRYCEWCTDMDYTAETIRRKKKFLLDLLKSGIDIYTARKPELESYVMQESRGMSAKTYNRHLDHLRSFYKWLYEEELITYNPAAGIRQKREEKVIPRILNEEQILQLINCPPDKQASKLYHERDTLMIILAVVTGMRRGEILNLKKEDFYMDDNNPFIIARKTKTKSDRILGIPHGEIAQRLKAYIEKNSRVYIFEDYFTHNKLSPQAATKILERRMKKLGIFIPNSGWHALRHAFCTRIIFATNGNMFGTMLLMGHEKSETTMRYFHTNPHYVRSLQETDPLFTKFQSGIAGF